MDGINSILTTCAEPTALTSILTSANGCSLGTVHFKASILIKTSGSKYQFNELTTSFRLHPFQLRAELPVLQHFPFHI